MTTDISEIVDVTTEWNFVQTISTPTTVKTRSIPNITPTKSTKTSVSTNTNTKTTKSSTPMSSSESNTSSLVETTIMTKLPSETTTIPTETIAENTKPIVITTSPINHTNATSPTKTSVANTTVIDSPRTILINLPNPHSRSTLIKTITTSSTHILMKTSTIDKSR